MIFTTRIAWDKTPYLSLPCEVSYERWNAFLRVKIRLSYSYASVTHVRSATFIGSRRRSFTGVNKSPREYSLFRLLLNTNGIKVFGKYDSILRTRHELSTQRQNRNAQGEQNYCTYFEQLLFRSTEMVELLMKYFFDISLKNTATESIRFVKDSSPYMVISKNKGRLWISRRLNFSILQYVENQVYPDFASSLFYLTHNTGIRLHRILFHPHTLL